MTEPNKPLGMSDFFALEAGEYLERLDGLVAQGEHPNGDELDQVAGRPSGQVRAAEALGLDAGARAFVAREGAAIASALDRAAQALRANPTAHDPLQHVLRALQPLRGLAALADLPPLPDLLEGIERSIAELERSGLEPPAHIAELFRTAATAIARPARDVAERA